MTAARTIAYRALRQVLEAGQMTDEALTESRLATLAPRDRRFVRALLMAALRDHGRIKKLITPFLKTPENVPPEIWALLYLGAAQLLVLKTAPHAAVNETLELAVKENLGGLKGLLNAVLRRADRDGRAVFDKMPRRENFPEWLWGSWQDYPTRDTWPDILLAEPPLDLTVPRDIDVWAEKLGGTKITGQTLRLMDRHPRESGEPRSDSVMDSRFRGNDVTKFPGYDDGAWWVQDVAAAVPVQMLGDVTDLNVLDLCAAPGGKTMQLCAGGAIVTAVDSSAQRLVMLKENLTRMKFMADVQCADVMKFEPTHKFDVVLLDAPCSATGTIRRHPEILMHKTAEDVARLAALQRQMLNRAANWVKPGGRLLYCVCSLQPEEGENQIQGFLKSGDEFTLVEQRRIIPTDFGGADGFFAAVVQKQ